MMNRVAEHIDIWTAAKGEKKNGGRGRGNSANGQEAYGIKKLRELILDLAMQGKLVPQDPNDEPAGMLLEKIAQEKKRLIKEGKIKKQKKLPEISEEEKPFELPVGWEWARILDIGHDWGQKKPDNDFTYIEVSAIDNIAGTVKSPNQLTATEAPSRARKIVKFGTVIYSTVRPYLKNICVIDQEYSPEPIASTAFAILHPCQSMPGKFFVQYLRSPVFVNYVESVQTGIAYPAINDKQFFNGLVPIPPLSEQHRIVAKVDELITLCDRLEQRQGEGDATHQALVTTLLATLTRAADANELAAAWQRLSAHFHTIFTTPESIDHLKQTLLQLAVMGKLVPQDPNAEPAGVLMEKITQEKKRLIKEGKIKKQKKLTDISEDEKPFELPVGWEFSQLDSVVDITSGITKGRKLAGRTCIMVPYLRVANVQRGFLELDQIKDIDLPKDELDKFTVVSRDLLITEGGDWDKVGRTAIWRDELPLIVHQNHIFKARCILKKQNEVWLEKYLNSHLARRYFERSSKQTTNLASINKTQLRGCIIAIPPLSEQNRIVTKVNQLIALCDALKARLTDAQTTQRRLADAIVERTAA